MQVKRCPQITVCMYRAVEEVDWENVMAERNRFPQVPLVYHLPHTMAFITFRKCSRIYRLWGIKQTWKFCDKLGSWPTAPVLSSEMVSLNTL